MRRLLYPFEALLALLGIGLACLLPRGAAHALGRRLGARVAGRARRTARENLRLRLGLAEDAADRVARHALAQAGAAAMDLLRAPRITRRIVRRDLALPDETRRVLDALARGRRGAVFATCHFGNWELVNLALPHVGVRGLVIVRPPPHPVYRHVLDRLRGWTGQKPIYRSRAIRRCVRHVRQGGAVGITFDLPVPPQAGARTVDFFDVPTYTTLAPGYVAAVTEAPLHLIYTVPLGGPRYRLLLERIEVPAEGDPRARARAAMQAASARLEAVIRDYPDGWAWWLKRWSIRPDDAPREAWPTYSHRAAHFLPQGKPLPQD